MLEALVDSIEDEDLKTALTKESELVQGMAPTEAANHIIHCKVARAYDSKIKKIHLCHKDPDKMSMLCKALALIGAKRKVGRAPPGGAERVISQALAQIESR